MSVVAIDGPAGAGKSTVARALAAALGWDYVDTGAMYRAVALAAIEHEIEPTDGDALARLAAQVRFEVIDDRVYLEGADVTTRIRDPEVTGVVSEVSAQRAVRGVMARRQQELARAGDVVMEGRDIGTTVAPTAEVKVYLTASLPVRAERRARQLSLPQNPSTIAEIESTLQARDRADSARETSPLARADDALTIDSTELDVDAVVALIVGRVRASVR